MSLLNAIKNNKFIYSTLFVIITFLGVIFSYQYIFQTYFAMDEWSFWTQFLKYGPFYTISSAGLIGSLTGGIRFGLNLTNDIYFSLFGLGITPWHISFLVLHLINIFLLFLVLRKFKISPFSAFLASFFFAIASSGQEALSWPAAGMQVLGSTPFILLTILFTLKFIESKGKLFLVLAIICSYLSFLMRPTGIVTAGLVVILIFLFYKRTSLFRIPKIVFIFAVSIFIIGLGRLLIDYFDKLSILAKAGFNVVFFPLISFSHIFIPYRLMFRLSDAFINFYYPIVSKDSNFNTISHLIVSDYISIIASFFIIIFIYFLYTKVDKFSKKVIIFGLILFFVQYFVIALFYVERGGLSYLESRHTYTSVAGIALVLGILFDFALARYKTSKSSLKKYLYLGFFIFVGLWMCKEMTVTRREVRAQAIDDIAIRKTFESLQSLKLPNSNKMIFYLRSDRNYYYPTYYLPFKLPTAYMMSLAFYGRPFIDRATLGDLQSNNSYISSNNKEFGYFTEINPLAALVKSGKININDVVGLYFIDGSFTFRDTTAQTQEMIKNQIESSGPLN